MDWIGRMAEGEPNIHKGSMFPAEKHNDLQGG